MVGMPVIGVRFRVPPAALVDWAAEVPLGAFETRIETAPLLELGQVFSYVVAVGWEPLIVRFDAGAPRI